MAKLTYEGAVSKLETAKENKTKAFEALKQFKADNGIKKGAEPEKKYKKEFDKLTKAYEEAGALVDNYKEKTKELKPAKERVSKYDYPADVVSADDRKKYRAKLRKEAKGESKPKKDKDSKKEGKTSKKIEETKPVAKKKKKKAAASSSKED